MTATWLNGILSIIHNNIQVPTQNQQTINNYISVYGDNNTVTADNRQGSNQG